jgi:hypothetical protein
VWVKIGPNYNIPNPNVPTHLEGGTRMPGLSYPSR